MKKRFRGMIKIIAIALRMTHRLEDRFTAFVQAVERREAKAEKRFEELVRRINELEEANRKAECRSGVPRDAGTC